MFAVLHDNCNNYRLIGSFIVPESSRWLVLRNRKDEAIIALQSALNLSRRDATSKVESMFQLSQESSKSSGQCP